jgi:hypothetical protein
MNLTIGLEGATGFLLLIAGVSLMLRRLRDPN